jgi:hypothetical protein
MTAIFRKRLICSPLSPVFLLPVLYIADKRQNLNEEEGKTTGFPNITIAAFVNPDKNYAREKPNNKNRRITVEKLGRSKKSSDGEE